jgi:hypothetical protein
MRFIHHTSLAAAFCAASLVGLCLGAPALASGPDGGSRPVDRTVLAPLVADLYGVDHASHTNVWAVGELRTDNVRPLIEFSNGTTWTRQLIAGGGRLVGTLDSVSVVSASDVWAVGYHWVAGPDDDVAKSLIVHWDGSGWTQIKTPSPSATSNMLLSVSAVSASEAWAVGWANDANNVTQPLVLHWDGSTWLPTAAPAPGGAHETYYNAVTTVSPTLAWAVGSYYNGSASRTLIARWDGMEWSQVASPNPAGPNDSLTGITAIGTDAWAVGGYSPTDTTSRGLIAQWDGTQWKTVPSPNPSKSVWLSAVSASASNQVWAVGSYYRAGESKTLTQRWDGNTWTTVASPNYPKSGGTQLLGVATRTTRDANAVGYFYNGDTEEFAAVFEHWNGTRWILS